MVGYTVALVVASLVLTPVADLAGSTPSPPLCSESCS
jgi:hypothetical protein